MLWGYYVKLSRFRLSGHSGPLQFAVDDYLPALNPFRLQLKLSRRTSGDGKNILSCLVVARSIDFHSGLSGAQAILIGFGTSITRKRHVGVCFLILAVARRAVTVDFFNHPGQRYRSIRRLHLDLAVD